MGNSFVAAMAKGRVLLVALLLSLTLAGVLAVRRTDDDDDYDHHEAPADYEAAEASTSTGDYEAPKQTNTEEAAEDPNAPPRPSFLTGMAPVMAVMLASKMVPALDAGGSSIPMLISVMIYPRAVAYVEQNYGSDFNFHEDENMFTALNCAAALAVFAVVVNVGKAMGHFGPAGQDVIGQPAGPLSALEMVQGEPVDVTRAGSVKVVEFWGTRCPPCKTAIPHLNKLWKELTKEFGAEKIQFIGVSKGEEAEPVKTFITGMNGEMEYPIGIDSSDITQAYPVSGIPHAFVVGKDGIVCWSGHPGDGTPLNTAVREAMAAEAAPKLMRGETVMEETTKATKAD